MVKCVVNPISMVRPILLPPFTELNGPQSPNITFVLSHFQTIYSVVITNFYTNKKWDDKSRMVWFQDSLLKICLTLKMY